MNTAEVKPIDTGERMLAWNSRNNHVLEGKFVWKFANVTELADAFTEIFAKSDFFSPDSHYDRMETALMPDGSYEITQWKVILAQQLKDDESVCEGCGKFNKKTVAKCYGCGFNYLSDNYNGDAATTTESEPQHVSS